MVGGGRPAGMLLRGWRLGRARVTVHVAPCVVTRPPPVERRICRALVNSANTALAGTKLPYFPMPEAPPAGLGSTSWGGMEAGGGLFYRTQVVDGIVDELGGAELRKLVDALPQVAPGVKLPEGGAVITAAPGLAHLYDMIVHTAAPLFPAQEEEPDPRDEAALLSCYEQSLLAAFRSGARVITLPLIGAGARGAPVGLACKLAAHAAVGLAGGGPLGDREAEDEIQFVCLEERVGARLVREIEGLLHEKYFADSHSKLMLLRVYALQGVP